MNIKKLTALSMLTAIALIIFIIEAQLPPLAPIPGIKLGLANTVTLMTLVWFGRKEAFLVLMLRIALGSVFAGTMMSFVYSAAGGMLCFLVMSTAWHFIKESQLWVISILGALAHNAGQVAAAVIFTSLWQITAYLPILAVSAIITGAFTGVASMIAVKRIPINSWRKDNEK